MISPREQSDISIDRILSHAGKSRHRLALTEALGDAHLCKTNPIYLRVRKQVISAKYRFVPDSKNQYRAWSVMGLPSILKSKQIPFKNNRAPMMKLSLSARRALQLPELINCAPDMNLVFHESCHAIAYKLLDEMPREFKLMAKQQARFVSMSLFLESCANATEYLANCDVPEDQIEHFLFAMNSAIVLRGSGKQNAWICNSVLGSKVFLKVMIALFYARHLDISRLSKRELRQIVELAGNDKISATHLRYVENVCRQVLPSSKEFKLFTSPVYFKAAGYKGDLARELSERRTTYFDDLATYMPFVDRYTGLVL